MPIQMDIPALEQFLLEWFPQVADEIRIEALDHQGAVVWLKVGDHHLRPGGTVSGPSIFLLADVAVYLALLARIGPQALAVTTNCTINFLRKPGSADIQARSAILKLGKTLCVSEVGVYSGDSPDPVAHAVLTYSIPPAKMG